MKNKKGWGFDTKRIDRNVRPQDDFYRYANGSWMKNTKIPKTEPRWGSFTMLRFMTEHQLKGLLQEISKKKKLKKGSIEQKVRDLYISAMDLKSRDKLGIKPLLKWRNTIHKINNEKDLLETIAKLHKLGVGVPWATGVDQDSKNSSRYVLHIVQSGLGMPDKEYYLKNEPEFLRVRSAYVSRIEKIFKLLGYKNMAKTAVQAIMNIETKLAKISMDKEDMRDTEKTYHKKTILELKRLTPEINWDEYFKGAGIPKIPYTVITQPEFLKEAAKLLSSISLDDWKTYLEWHLVESTSPYLTNTFTKLNFEYYGKVLTGSKKMKPEWRRALSVVNGMLGEGFGEIYIKKHFPREAKRKMNILVDDLFRAYERRIKRADWMTPVTKKKAVAKLKMMQRKIGYPSRFRNYKSLSIEKNNFFGNILRAIEFEHDHAVKKLKKPIDRNEWHMSPQTVNAYCNFNLNEIVFPAAILQEPFFNLNADDGINYGAIGAVIGHEITHGFDDQGSKFDGHGNMKNWWTKKDREQYEKKSKIIVKQYDAYTISDDIHVNGKLTLGENIADLGGLVIAFDAYQERLKKIGRQNIAGFTPEQRFFLGAARVECELYRDEYAKTKVLNDPHSPPQFRINGPFANMDEFYKAYDVKKGDKLYIEPSKRAKIW